MKTRPILVLWDIDRTLLTTGGAGQTAFLEAGRKTFGEAFTMDGVDTLGRLDTAIWRDAVRLNGNNGSPELEPRFRQAYQESLKKQINLQSTIRLLPGVRKAVGYLGKIEHLTQGILSGNYPEIGRLKLEGASLDSDQFAIWVGGTDGESRSDLVSVALTRYTELTLNSIETKRVTIIGDTPRDIDCAKANGCRCLAVTTGRFSRRILEKAGADLVLDNLTQTNEVVNWICR
ncbi:MAG: HAD hydrolase-like protein [Proteobacteria bacterium]|nr:HAD hydrolase-like protein [Pseudomonadota bacterium]